MVASSAIQKLVAGQHFSFRLDTNLFPIQIEEVVIAGAKLTSDSPELRVW